MKLPFEPEPETWEEAAKIVVMELVELCVKKQFDYGTGNILKFGEQGILVRVSDKVERLINLGDKEAKNEPQDDSWNDIGGYVIVRNMLKKGWFGLPLRGDKIDPPLERTFLDGDYGVLSPDTPVHIVFKDDSQDEYVVFLSVDNKNGWLEVRRGFERLVYPVSRIDYIVLGENK